ncbi:GNAT family N-acetyltransferase [Pleionea sp. CnH1-48]|uniref:GNAT family N-acetyltransferase n=1 Tax=Pleionea sp. CnH1-48 TaxID=2954494 RepID=UPI00209818B1|nr:GNAT family N-acetyltransferase [Pleionea sp. CnH1-48]MCO7224283.1 GNAT family N-acetyltransferase [Pleionea sp. CnH1-48]
MSTLTIRDFELADAKALTDIFYDTIHEVGLEYYTQEQINEWAPLPIDYQHWTKRLEDWPPFVAIKDDVVVGFITLTESGHIEWTYTHKDYQRQGIASQLYDFLEQKAKLQGLSKLTVNASKFASPFFSKQGFETIEQVNSERNGQILVNWLMEKHL